MQVNLAQWGAETVQLFIYDIWAKGYPYSLQKPIPQTWGTAEHMHDFNLYYMLPKNIDALSLVFVSNCAYNFSEKEPVFSSWLRIQKPGATLH